MLYVQNNHLKATVTKGSDTQTHHIFSQQPVVFAGSAIDDTKFPFFLPRLQGIQLFIKGNNLISISIVEKNKLYFIVTLFEKYNQHQQTHHRTTMSHYIYVHVFVLYIYNFSVDGITLTRTHNQEKSHFNQQRAVGEGGSKV